MGCAGSNPGKGKQADQPVVNGGEKKRSTTSSAEKEAQENGAKTQEKSKNEVYEEKVYFISKVPLMRKLKRDQHPIVAAMMEARQYKPGDVVIKQGDKGNEFFIIRSGQAGVHVKSQDASASSEIATLKEKDYFGEQSLLREEPRNATITAKTTLSVFVIKREKFQSLDLSNKLNFPSRKAVMHGGSEVEEDETGGHSIGKMKSLNLRDTSKTKEEREFILKSLRANANLCTMVSTEDKQWGLIADVAYKQVVEAGVEILKFGSKQADKFYIVQDGEFEVISYEAVEDDEKTFDMTSSVRSMQSIAGSPKTGEQITKSVTGGGSFGEVALLYLAPSTLTVTAKKKSVVWTVERIHFKNILMQASDAQIDLYGTYLDTVDILSSLLNDEKRELAKALVELTFAKDDEIFAQGAEGSTFYILYDGEVEILKDGVKLTSMAAKPAMKQTKVFGEQALLENEVRSATVKVISDQAKALALHRADFECLLGPLREIIALAGNKGRKSRADKSRRTTLHSKTAKSEKRVDFCDLQRVGLLGSGGFGWVELWEHKASGETYALKAVGKGLVVENQMQTNIVNEKNILLMTDSRFIIKLYETYVDKENLYFLMEPGLGGELFHLYNKHKLHGSEIHAKYYVAGTVLAFFHLHERHIIYRDLKPENLLLDSAGHVKLTDMGLAKFCIGKTYTTCGTPDYFAPEVISCSGHGDAVDWWCIGIFIFELMNGSPPFEAADPMDTYQKVMKGIGLIPMPAKLSAQGVDLIKALLRKLPSERLPMRPKGRDLLKQHKWFSSSIDWPKLEAGKFEPPFKPQVKSKKDLTNFKGRAKRPDHAKYVDDGSGWDLEFATCG